MARQRLSWTKEAETVKKADPYTMNQDHKNNPVSKYDIGGPSQFAEDPDMKTPWKTEGRTETGHPAPAREAVKAARMLEDKALKCITIAQRMLPGASDDEIEVQATDLMYLPDHAILATLQRQASLAERLANEKSEEDEEEEEEKEAAVKEEEEKKEETTPKPEKKAEEKKEETIPEPEKKKAEKEEEEEEEKEAAAKKEETTPKPEKKDAKKKEPEEEDEEKMASKKASELNVEFKEDDIDLLDSLFANEEKVGARKLSGIVKKASTDVELSSLWSAPPDVSEAFGLK